MRTPGRAEFKTALRAVFCAGIFWLLFPHDFARPEVLLGLATALCLLAVYELASRDISPDGLLAAVAVILSVSAIGWLAWAWFFPPPPEPKGPLIAAGEPSPATTCGVRPGEMVMAFGTDRVMAAGKGPFKPFMAGECPGPILTRKGQGLLVTAFGYDWSSDIAYGIVDNKLEFTEGAGLHVRRPDPSTFMLLDRFEDEVVYVRYLNPHAVRLRGRLLCGEAPQIVIHDRVILAGGVRIGGVMFGQHPMPGKACARLAPGMDHGLEIGAR